MFCLLRWWKAPFGVCLESLKLQYSTQTHPLVFKRKTQFALCFPKCAALTNRTDTKTNPIHVNTQGQKKMQCSLLHYLVIKNTKIVFCFFFNVGELAALPSSSGRTRGPVINIKEVLFSFSPFFLSFPVSFAPFTRVAHPARCFLISVNKSQSDCFSDRCWAQPVDQAVVSLPRNIVPEWIRTLFSLCYDFVINVYIFLIFWHHMNKDMYVWMCIYMIYIDRCIYIYIYMASILEEVPMLDLVFRRWTEMALCGRSKKRKRQKKISEQYVELPDGESRLLPCALKDQFN